MAGSVSIVGGGFSGLVTAYFCAKKGLKVELFEASSRLGGLIDSVHDGYGVSETAANGLLDSERLRAVAQDIGLDLIEPKSTAKARYIYRQHKARRWPLGVVASLRLMVFVARFFLFRQSLKPRSGESLGDWGHRCVGDEATTYLLEPALRGIYAGNINRLSASLLLSRLFSPKKSSARKRKLLTVSPKKGMGELSQKLEAWLKAKGVQIFLEHPIRSLAELKGEHLILACGPDCAARLLEEHDSKAALSLRRLELSSVISITQNFKPRVGDLKGFGCLFPRVEGFYSLGVLFNSDIFDYRSSYRSEKWIMGGAQDGAELIQKSDEELLALLQQDRLRLTGRDDKPLSVQIHRWPQALPHYSIELEEELPNLSKLRDIRLVGNYLGRIGLSDILASAESLAESIGGDS